VLILGYIAEKWRIICPRPFQRNIPPKRYLQAPVEYVLENIPRIPVVSQVLVNTEGEENNHNTTRQKL
jgi:hypothetical protein